MNIKKQNFFFEFSLILILILLFFLISNNFFVFYGGRYFNGCDMMWSPSSLFLQNINVFEIYFSNLKDQYIHCSNYPSYSLSNIFFMIPFGAFELNIAKKLWLLFNLILIFHIYFIFKKLFTEKQTYYNFIFLTFLFSKPMILTLCIGQYGVLALWAITSTIFYEKKSLISFLGFFVAGLKYTFFPIIFYYKIYKKKYVFIILFLLLNLTALLIYSFKFKIGIIENFLNPLIVGSQQGGGGGDLMSVLGNHPVFPLNYLTVIISSFFYFIIFYNKTVNNTENKIIYVTLITITIFRHHIYDAIFLFPLFLYLIKSSNKIKFFLILIVLYFWFIYHSNFLEQGSILPVMYTKGFRMFNFILLNMLVLFFFLDTVKPNQYIFKFKMNKLKKKFQTYVY